MSGNAAPERHPTDDQGRMLPHPSWPDDRQATGELEFLRHFLNSTNNENGAERFSSPAGLDRWLLDEQAQPVSASAAELDRVLAVRAGLRRLTIANGRNGDDPEAWIELMAASAGVALVPRADSTGIALVPCGSPIESLIGRLLLAIVDARRDGSWLRLKACQHCRWVVFDPSKNRSSRWCSMSACGGRHNAREYRRRVRDT